MTKNFDDWSKQKKLLDDNQKDVLFNENEVWWCSIGLNVGVEMDGKNENYERPVLIIKKFSRESFLGIPLTATNKQSIYKYKCTINNTESYVCLNQSKTLSSKRLIRKIVKIGRVKFKEIKTAFSNI